MSAAIDRPKFLEATSVKGKYLDLGDERVNMEKRITVLASTTVVSIHTHPTQPPPPRFS